MSGGYLVTQVGWPWPEKSRFLVVGAFVPDSVFEASEARSRFWSVILTSSVLLVVGLSAVVRPLSRGLTRPLLALVDVVRQFQNGDLQARAPLGRVDEIGLLAAAFNQMAEHIAQERSRLESQVQERTLQLGASEKAARRRAAWAQGLQKAGEELAACQTIAEVARVAAQAPVAHLGARRAWVTTVAQGDREVLASSYPDVLCQAELCQRARLVRGTGRKQAVPDVLEQPPQESCRQAAATSGFQSCVTCPRWPRRRGDRSANR